MLKNITIKRISITTIALLICLLFFIFPDNNLDIKEEITYISDAKTHEIYMVNKDNYIAKTDVILSDEKTEDKIRTLIEYLIIDGKKEDNVPNGFRSIIPSGTKINSINLENNILKIDFSSEILEIDEELEEKMYESIVYTLTSIDEVKGIIISVNNEVIKQLPKSKTKIPDILDRTFGINKKYDITNNKNITKTTVYYLSNINDNYEYVPITMISNDNNSKINIIVEELTNSIIDDNLISFLNINTKLLSFDIKDNNMYLVFNEYIYDNIENKDILDEVVNCITYSVKDNYNIDNVVFIVNDEVIKTD